MRAKETRFLELFNGKVQYLVPRWQRPYRWGDTEIRRLVEDLLAIAAANDEARPHYGGTMITVLERTGVLKVHRVVDGQQRLTTVSLLLARIAEVLGADGKYGELTAAGIRLNLLTNPKRPEERRFKLRLQDGDDEEYRRIIDFDSLGSGGGALSRAWRVVKRNVTDGNVERLIEGLHRLRVISIGLEDRDDPQQIFESLNGTGKPLTEGEKVKNWLLMGLSEEIQDELHDEHWLEIESSLDARHAPERIDLFLRDVMRWRTGRTVAKEETYDGFRRWAIGEGRDNPKKRPELCRELASLAALYGQITDTAAKQPSPSVKRELDHLRALGIHVHRPFSLRLLWDAQRLGPGEESLLPALTAVSRWVTRAWLAGGSLAGLDKAFAQLAHTAMPADEGDHSQFWIGQISGIDDERIAVPSDTAVREGIQLTSKYGGLNTRATAAVLYAMVDREQRGEVPARVSLTVEHIMPQTLNQSWLDDLSERGEEIHEQHVHRLGNLTLCGDRWNPALSNHPFGKKRALYRKSSILMTRRLADLAAWDESAIKERATALTDKALELWPWAGA